MRRTGFLAVLLLAAATRAFAQDGGAPAPVTPPWRLSLGGGINMALIPGEGSGFLTSAKARVDLGFGLAAEVGADFFRGLEGFYLLEVRAAPSRPAGAVSPFATIGTVGAFESRHVNERRTTLPTGDVAIYPAHRYGRLTRPFAITGGGGATIRLPAGLSLDAGGELWVSGDGPLISFQTTLLVPLWGRRR